MVRLLGVGTYVQTEHDDRDDVVGQGDIDIVHDQSLVVSEARVGVDYGVNRWLSASVVVPVRLVKTEITYFDTAGNEVQLVRDGLHHRDEVVSGVADPMVLGAVSGMLGGGGGGGGGVSWSVRGGVTVPLGRTEENPFVLGDMLLPHQHIQLGTGTVNPVLAVDVARSWGGGAWRVGGFAFTQQVLYENGKGYHAGDRYAGGVTLRRGLGGGRWGVRGGVEVQAETAEKWGGIAHTDDGNRGRIDGMVGVGASWAASRALTVDLAVKVPVVTHVVGGQLDMPAIAEVGVTWSIGGKVDEEADVHVHVHDDDHDDVHDDDHDGDHDHDHGDDHDHDDGGDEHGGGAEPFVHPDTTGLDVLDVGKPGEAVALVPVPGKVTIFDFWATWCVPCKKLEPALVEIARRNPDKVAIRRIDALDWDSEAVAKYLTPGGFNLPHVKVFDASGKLVLEKGAEPGKLDELIEAVRKTVEPGTPAPPPQTQPQSQPQPQPQPPLVKPVSVKIVVTEKGFEPVNVTVPRGRPVTLVFERKTAKTCATEVIFVADGKRVEQELPLDTPVAIKLTFKAPGTIKYACGMDMVRGTITVR